MPQESRGNDGLNTDLASNWMLALATTSTESEAHRLLTNLKGPKAIIEVTGRGLFVPSLLFATQSEALSTTPEIEQAIKRSDTYVAQLVNWCDDAPEAKEETQADAPRLIACTRIKR